MAFATALATQARAEPPKMKMTTKISAGIATPDKLETRLGTLDLIGGVPGSYFVVQSKTYDVWNFMRGYVGHRASMKRLTTSKAA